MRDGLLVYRSLVFCSFVRKGLKTLHFGAPFVSRDMDPWTTGIDFAFRSLSPRTVKLKWWLVEEH